MGNSFARDGIVVFGGMEHLTQPTSRRTQVFSSIRLLLQTLIVDP